MRFDLRVNGRTYPVEGEAGDSLLSVLRYELGITGPKFGCGEGFCGACTVHIDGVAVRSCVARLGTLSGKSITTIEGLAAGDALHPLQQAFIDADAMQCGYCTAGMIMAAAALLKSMPQPSDDDIARVMDHNVCRCGTYPRIVTAIKNAAAAMHRHATSAPEHVEIGPNDNDRSEESTGGRG